MSKKIAPKETNKKKKNKTPTPRDIERLTVDKVPQPSWKEMGEGGEAIVYKSSSKTVVKVFRHWNDPWFIDSPDEQKAAKEKFVELQKKLLLMPEMPEGVVAPQRILQTPKGSIFGYEMNLVSGAIPIDTLWNISTIKEKLIALDSLYDLIRKLHKIRVIIGDFVPRDILWDRKNKRIYLLDSDSLQFSDFKCKSFSIGFADRKVLKFSKGKKTKLINVTLKRPYYKQSDWVSFLAICTVVMIGVDPYGGVHKGFSSKEERVKSNLSIFHPDVIYPKTAKQLKDIPRPLLEALYKAFHLGKRFIPKKALFAKDKKGENNNE